MSFCTPEDTYEPVATDKQINVELPNYNMQTHNLESLVEDAIALMYKQLEYKVKMVEAETARKVVSITEIIKPHDAYSTYKLTLDNDAVISVSIKKPYCK